MVEQLPEEVELLRRELDLLVADARLAATGVDAEVPVTDDLALDRRDSGVERRRIDFTRATSSRGLNGFVM